MSNLTSDEVVRVIYKLVGNIDPIGDSQHDAEAYDNLKVLIHSLYGILDNLAVMELILSGSKESSVKKISDECTKFLNDLGEIYSDKGRGNSW